jgi:drug/metabolite transporter (DMT)-like permease
LTPEGRSASVPPAPPGSAASLRSDALNGILLAIGASVSFAMLDSIAKYLATTYPTPMVAWARYFFHVLVMLAILLPRWGLRLVATRQPMLQVGRGLCLGLSSITFFAALARMPQAEATAIVATAPILVTVAAVLWLRERAPRGTWVALAASFVGVMLIIRPGSAVFGADAALPLLTVVFSAAYMLLTRRLAGVDDSVATLFIGGVVATVLLCTLLPFVWTTPQSWFHLLLFVCAGTIGAGGHLLLVRAYERASATTLAPFAYAHTVAALPLAWLVFGTFPDRWSLAGMAVIVATGVAMAFMRR